MEQLRGLYYDFRKVTPKDLLLQYHISEEELKDKKLGWDYVKYCWPKDEKLSFEEFKDLYEFLNS